MMSSSHLDLGMQDMSETDCRKKDVMNSDPCSALIGVATFCFGHDPQFESDNHVALAGKHSASYMHSDEKTEDQIHSAPVSSHKEQQAGWAWLVAAYKHNVTQGFWPQC